MKDKFTCYSDFIEGLNEVNIILLFAKEYENEATKYSIFNRTGLLLLLSKFECFLENLIEEYVYELEQLKVSTDDLPLSMKFHITNFAFNDDFIVKLRNCNPSVIKGITGIIPIWNIGLPISILPINKKFDYGKHGSKAINKLFQRIGIEDIFQSCPIYETRENVSKRNKVHIEVDIKGEINSMTNYRNTILHENVSPSLTHNQIEKYKDRIVLFANSLNELLIKNKNAIAKKTASKNRKRSNKK